MWYNFCRRNDYRYVLKIEKDLGTIHLVRTQNFPKNWHFLLFDKHKYVGVSGGKDC